MVTMTSPSGFDNDFDAVEMGMFIPETAKDLSWSTSVPVIEYRLDGLNSWVQSAFNELCNSESHNWEIQEFTSFEVYNESDDYITIYCESAYGGNDAAMVSLYRDEPHLNEVTFIRSTYVTHADVCNSDRCEMCNVPYVWQF